VVIGDLTEGEGEGARRLEKLKGNLPSGIGSIRMCCRSTPSFPLPEAVCLPLFIGAFPVSDRVEARWQAA
jgi:hypothetical protein